MNKELLWSLFESTGNIEFYIKYCDLRDKELLNENKNENQVKM